MKNENEVVWTHDKTERRRYSQITLSSRTVEKPFIKPRVEEQRRKTIFNPTPNPYPPLKPLGIDHLSVKPREPGHPHHLESHSDRYRRASQRHSAPRLKTPFHPELAPQQWQNRQPSLSLLSYRNFETEFPSKSDDTVLNLSRSGKEKTFADSTNQSGNKQFEAHAIPAVKTVMRQTSGEKKHKSRSRIVAVNYPVRITSDLTKKRRSSRHVKFIEAWSAVKHSQFDTLELYLQTGYVNKRSNTGKTLLHHACYHGHNEMVQFLLQHNGDPNLLDYSSNTCFHLACRNGHEDVVVTLLKSGKINLHLKDAQNLSCHDAVFSYGIVGGIHHVIHHRRDFKTNLSMATNFITHASKYKGDVSLRYVNFLKVKDFLNFGQIPHYGDAVNNDYLVQGLDITAPETCAILFVSHRWETDAHPDPSQQQYKTIKQYLNQMRYEGTSFQYMWIDYSCICQPEVQKNLFLKHLANIPTSIFLSSHLLVVPKDVTDNQLEYSDINDYASRGWCQMEILLCMVSGCLVDIALSYQKSTEFINVRGGLKMLKTAAEDAINHYSKTFGEHLFNSVWLQEKWNPMLLKTSEPSKTLKLAVCALREIKDHKEQEVILKKIFQFQLEKSDVVQHKGLNDTYNSIENLKEDADRIIILRCLLLALAFCLGYFQAGQTLEEAPSFNRWKHLYAYRCSLQ